MTNETRDQLITSLLRRVECLEDGQGINDRHLINLQNDFDASQNTMVIGKEICPGLTVGEGVEPLIVGVDLRLKP